MRVARHAGTKHAANEATAITTQADANAILASYLCSARHHTVMSRVNRRLAQASLVVPFDPSLDTAEKARSCSSRVVFEPVKHETV